MIYFDNASTTSVRTEVRRVYGQVLETCYGNPDSLHVAGRQASSLMEKSRSNIASMLHVDPSEIIFTSAASESNTWPMNIEVIMYSQAMLSIRVFVMRWSF